MKIHVNPEAKAFGEFGYVGAGDYRMRIKEASFVEKKPGKSSDYIKLQMEFAEPVKAVEEDKVVGNVFDNVMTRADIQQNLKGLVDAAGLDWGDFEHTALNGVELTVRLKLAFDDAGKPSGNDVVRYVPAE